MKCSATKLGFRVNRLKDERCDGVRRVSEIGPGKPYCSMPSGWTGQPSASDGAVPGTGCAGPGTVGEGGSCAVWVGVGFCSLGREKTTALREAPAAADTAATNANVVFDISPTDFALLLSSFRQHEGGKVQSSSLESQAPNTRAGGSQSEHFQRALDPRPLPGPARYCCKFEAAIVTV